MHATFTRTPQRWSPGGSQIALVATLFWLFTYALLSFRAGLVSSETFSLVGGQRILAITVGAGFFGLALAWMKSRAAESRSTPVTVVATILPASIAVLVVRLFWDQFLLDEGPRLNENIRWVLVWAGYFGLWVSGYFAVQMRSEPLATPRQNHNPSQAGKVAAPSIGVQRELATLRDKTAWDWAIDAIADEIASSSPSTRSELADHLRARAGYEQADPLHAFDNARAHLLNQIARRLDVSRL